MNETPLCRKSSEAARKAGELRLWRDSFQANILCRIAIENEIRQHFDGMHLEDGCAGRVLDEFGEARVKYVLSATLQDRDYDGASAAPTRRGRSRRTSRPEQTTTNSW